MSQQAPEELFAGKFRMVKLLGRGAMGEVWLADEVGPRNFRRQVAVKRLLATEGISEYARESFLAEAQVIARLDHPNIVHLIELGESDDRGLYLVLDYIDGSALDGVIRKGGALSPGAVALVGREVAKALDAVHSMTDEYGQNVRVVHRDVSPANILIGRDGRVRLSDFGVARIHGLGGEKTETGVFKGKLPYMPPEQALGEPFDGRADIFSLGITLYEGLLGGRLRKAETQGQLIAMIATERVPRVLDRMPQAMPELAQAIDFATEFKSAARVASAGELAMHLHNVLYLLGPGAEEAAVNELCERVTLAAGASQAMSTRPWSMALSGENPQYGSGPRSMANPVSALTPAQAQSRVGGAAPSVPPEGPGQASVTRVATITDASARPQASSGRTWFYAISGAIILGCAAGATFVLLTPPRADQGRNAATAPAGLDASASSTAAASSQARPDEGAPGVSATAPSASASETVLSLQDVSASPRPFGPIRPTPPTSSTSGDVVNEASGNGTLLVTVNPWGNVTVDGAPKGQTPIGAISLPPGVHTVVVHNPEMNASRSATVRITAGKTSGVRFDLKKSGP